MNWTYGAEFEFSDWDRRVGIPVGFKLDERDVTMVNSNGIAVDPKGKMYPYGGEFNTPPTETLDGQVQALCEILDMHSPTINYRSNLHIHVRIPELSQNLQMLKLLARYNLKWLSRVLPLIEPIPEPKGNSLEELKGARRRFRRRKRSHQTLLTTTRVERQLTAHTIQEFHELGVPMVDGKAIPFLQPRAAVNLRQLLETDTIEFRHFPGTLCPTELMTALMWCKEYLIAALNGGNPLTLFYDHFKSRPWPQFQPYVHWMEERYRLTTHDGTVPKEEIQRNIEVILREDSRLVPR